MIADARSPFRKELSRSTWRHVRTQVSARDHGVCQACGAIQPRDGRRSFPVSHKIAPERYKGSHNDPSNLLVLCWACNASQGAEDFDVWLARPYGRPALIRSGQAATAPPSRPSARRYGGPSVPVKVWTSASVSDHLAATRARLDQTNRIRYHHHKSGSIAPGLGNMSIRPTWTADGCPPECDLPVRP